MADKNNKFSNPVRMGFDPQIVAYSQERVAFDLMRHIAAFAEGEPKEQKKNRHYWFALYRECRMVIRDEIPAEPDLKPE